MPWLAALRTTFWIVARLYQLLTLFSGLVTTTLAWTVRPPPASTSLLTVMAYVEVCLVVVAALLAAGRAAPAPMAAIMVPATSRFERFMAVLRGEGLVAMTTASFPARGAS